MASLKCSFGSYSKKDCGISSRYKEHTLLLPLHACKKDVTSYLRSCYSTRADDIVEWQLCLLRIGLFEESGDSFTICPQHRDEFGLGWRPSKMCKHPLHDCNQKPVRGVTRDISLEIYKTWGVLLQIGQGICYKCLENHRSLAMESKCGAQYQTPLKSGKKTSLTPEITRPRRIQVDPGIYSQLEGHYDDLLSPMSSLTEKVESMSFDEEEYLPTPSAKSGLQTLNRSIEALSGGRISPVRFQLNQPISDVARSTRIYIKRKSKEILETALECIAPGQSSELLSLVTETSTIEKESPEEKVVKNLVSLYDETRSWYTKRTILSIFVNQYTKSQLKTMIPGLTDWRIDQARKHVAVVGMGVQEERDPVIRYRLDGEKVDHFLDFISSPIYTQDVAFGTRKLKLSSGEDIEIPNLVRMVINSRMINIYQAYCHEVDFTPLGKSTLFSILKVCASSSKKSLAGLDNTTTEGSAAFDTLEDIVNTMGSLGISLQWVDNTRQRIRAARKYLKADFKLHVADQSPCSDHCIRFALSSNDTEFASACNHDHNIDCDRCIDCKRIPNDVIDKLKSTSHISFRYEEQQEELLYDAEKAKAMIMEWKSHIVRTINQEKSKANILDDLDRKQALIIMDWAMKWLPKRYREAQTDWFGKKGLSWHVSACITRAKSQEIEFEVRTFVHIFDQCSQDWFAVESVIDNLLGEIVKTTPDIKEIFLRSDNAGCYHNGQLLISLPTVAKRKGLILKNYSFSESNSGKDVCDRKIAPLKAHVTRYLNEGNDVTTAAQLQEAIESYGGVKGCFSTVTDINLEKQISTTIKWSGISQFNNFQYNADGSITVWKSFDIGKGKKISKKAIKKMGQAQEETGVIIKQPSSKPKEPTGLLKKGTGGGVPKQPSAPETAATVTAQSESEDKSNVWFTCPEQGCTKGYRTHRSLQNHLDYGKHTLKLHVESQYDEIIRKWAAKCTSIKSKNLSASSMKASGSQDTDSGSSTIGWALHKSKGQNRFSDKVKNFLLEQFLVGEETGRKITPSEASTRMRSLRDDVKGLRVFSKEEWLTTQQVRSYFSRLSTLKKSGKLPKAADLQVEEEVILAVVERETRYQLRRRVYSELTL